MRQRFAIAALAIAALALPTAWAVTTFNGNTAPSGAHYANGEVEPTCSVSGLTVSCTGTAIGGVGNLDATVLLSVSYEATVQCTNKGGNTVDVKTQLTTSGGSNGDTRSRNGTLTVAAISSTATDVNFTSRATCPNGNWTKAVVEGTAVVTGFTYTLTFDGFGQPVIVVTG
jgi:hypothetical protein